MLDSPDDGDPERRAMRYEIDRMRAEDVDRVVEIERECFPDPWPRASFLYEVRDNPFAVNYVLKDAEASGRILGYTCLWFIEGELHINNVAVDPGARRRGLGRSLMRHALDEATRRGCRSAVLQVRPSNEAALSLYRSFGFSVVGRRKRYYSQGREDALLMTRSFPGS
jgi:[ribosomal protein S18]-alanine N-acetyltransferase